MPYPYNNAQKEAIGLLTVQRVLVDWASGWQEYHHRNDDAIDGVILMSRGRKRPYKTGGLVFVQVKCGGDGYRRDQAQHPDHICVAVGPEYVDKHRPRWNRVPGPAVLIFVDDTLPGHPAWWVDLKDDGSYSATNRGIILVPKRQRFSAATKGTFHRLCGSGPSDRELEEVRLQSQHIFKPQLGRNESLRSDAWEFYKDWRADADSCINPTIGQVLVNRVGWKHITRHGRASERIVQSWMLLPAAKEMIRTIADVEVLGRAAVIEIDGDTKNVVDYLGIRAVVTFPYRHHSVVQVVLKRSRMIDKRLGKERTKVWFFSVYERRRGAGMV